MKHWIMWSKHCFGSDFQDMSCHSPYIQAGATEWMEDVLSLSARTYYGLQTNWNISYRAATGRSQSIGSYFYGCKEDSWSATNINFTSAVPVVMLWIENIRMKIAHEEHSNSTLLNQKQELCAMEKVSCNTQLSLFPWSHHIDPLVSPRQQAQTGLAKGLL